VKKNVGTLDSHIRLFIGFSLLGNGIIRSSKTMVGLGAMKIATGITRFCPILHILKISTVEQEKGIEKFIENIPEYTQHVKEDLGME